MSKKIKKRFKKIKRTHFKFNLNNRWTNWRRLEIKHKKAQLLLFLKKIILQSLFQDHSVNELQLNDFLQIIKLRLEERIYQFDKHSYKSLLKNYCHFIGRGRSLNRKFFIARHTLRKFIRFGIIPGIIQERC